MKNLLVSKKAAEATKIILTCILIGFTLWAGIVIVGLFIASGPGTQPRVTTIPDAPARFEYLPSQADIQREPVRRGYDIGVNGVDGVIGKDTRAPWDEAVNTQYALESWPEDSQ